MPDLRPGLTATFNQIVTPEMTARHVGSGSVDVFATPELALLLEKTAVAALADSLPAGQTTVGTNLTFDHLAATPVGLTVSATATLIRIDERLLIFEISASDDVESIARGSHTRFLVDEARFNAKAQQKQVR